MQLSGHVQAMDTSLIDGDAYYQLPIGEEKIDMNALLGQRIELKYNDAINELARRLLLPLFHFASKV